jgi:DNA repair exonuclease SbcCD ATPase subunit
MRTRGLLLALVAVILAACTSQREPAENAVARVVAALDEIRPDAQNYASEQLQAVESSVKRLKANLDKKDYSSVVQGAPSVASEVEALKTTVAQAKADAEANLAAAQSEWTDLSASVPPLVEKLQARVDQLTKSRKYPKGMDKAAFDTAKAGFESLKTEWTDATADFDSGHPADAVRKARAAKSKAQDLASQLEVPG